MSTITVKELAAPTGFDLKIASGETLDLKSQGTVTMPTGTILRQFFTRITGNLNTTSTSYVDLGGSITLTPLSTSSKFFITTSVHSYLSSHTTDGWHAINYQILRDSTVVTGSDATNGSYGYARFTRDNEERQMSYVHRQFQDEPATTSQIVYKVQVQSRFGYETNFNEFGESSMAILEVQG